MNERTNNNNNNEDDTIRWQFRISIRECTRARYTRIYTKNKFICVLCVQQAVLYDEFRVICGRSSERTNIRSHIPCKTILF